MVLGVRHPGDVSEPRGLAGRAGWQLRLAGLGQPAIVAAVVAALFAYLAWPMGDFRVADPDVFWIAAVGRDVVRSHAMPHVNGYSFADGSYPWIMHEGLFGLLFFEGARMVGPAFFTLFGVGSAAALLFLLLAYVLGQSRSAAAGGLCGVVILSCGNLLLSPRPAFVALLFVAGMIAVAVRPGWSVARAAAAVGLELVWTNAHGSFPLGVVLVLVAALDDGRTKDERRRWLATAALAALVTLVNPYGYRLHGLVDRYLRGSDETGHIIQTHIQGFAHLWRGFGTGFVTGRSLAVLVLLVVLAIRAIARRKGIARAVVVLAGVGMAVYQVRTVALAIVLGVLLLHDAVDDALAPVGLASTAKRWAPWIAAAAVLPGLLLGAGSWGKSFRERSPLAWVNPSLGGMPFLRLIHALPDGARVYAPFKPSALVLWFEAERGVKVLYDPRNDCYSPEVARGALELGGARQSREAIVDFLDRYGTEYAVVPHGPIATALTNDSSWERWRGDGEWAAFHRR